MSQIRTEDLLHHDPSMAPVSKGRGAVSKVEKFGWTIVDTLGTFKLINKRDLMIPREYQRDEKPSRTLLFASEWSWIACGAVSVCIRNGVFYVVDGQHRVLAARRRSDITMMPCMVFESEGVAAEARAFRILNSTRVGLPMMDKFRALLAEQHPTALAVRAMVEDSGYRIANNPGRYTVRAIGVLMRAYDISGDTIATVWRLLMELADGAPVDGIPLEALFFIERRMQVGFSLEADIWRRRLKKHGLEGITMAARRAAVYHARGGAAVWAKGIVDLLNTGLSDDRCIVLQPTAKRGPVKAILKGQRPAPEPWEKEDGEVVD